MQQQIRLAFEDCDKGNEAAVTRRIAVVHNLLGMNTKLTLTVFFAAGILAASLAYAKATPPPPDNHHGMMQHGDMSSMMAARTRMMDACAAMMQAKVTTPNEEKVPDTTP